MTTSKWLDNFGSSMRSRKMFHFANVLFPDSIKLNCSLCLPSRDILLKKLECFLILENWYFFEMSNQPHYSIRKMSGLWQTNRIVSLFDVNPKTVPFRMLLYRTMLFPRIIFRTYDVFDNWIPFSSMSNLSCGCRCLRRMGRLIRKW